AAGRPARREPGRLGVAARVRDRRPRLRRLDLRAGRLTRGAGARPHLARDRRPPARAARGRDGMGRRALRPAGRGRAGRGGARRPAAVRRRSLVPGGLVRLRRPAEPGLRGGDARLRPAAGAAAGHLAGARAVRRRRHDHPGRRERRRVHREPPDARGGRARAGGVPAREPRPVRGRPGPGGAARRPARRRLPADADRLPRRRPGAGAGGLIRAGAARDAVDRVDGMRIPRSRTATRLLALGAVAAAVALVLPACAADPPAATEVAVAGDITTHDPALVVTDDAWYVFSTGDPAVGGGAPQVCRSTDDGATWEMLGTVSDAATRPEWAYEAVPGATSVWAPEVVEHDGVYHLYYSVSTFGRNTSVIGLTTNVTLDPDDPDHAWTDQGMVWSSSPGDPYNAIDPGVITDESGTPWLAFGSFWGGIQLLELEWPSGKPVEGAEPVTIASRGTAENAIEAPY